MASKGIVASLKTVAALDIETLAAIETVLNHYTDGPSIITAIRIIKQHDISIKDDHDQP